LPLTGRNNCVYETSYKISYSLRVKNVYEDSSFVTAPDKKGQLCTSVLMSDFVYVLRNLVALFSERKKNYYINKVSCCMNLLVSNWRGGENTEVIFVKNL
jgi:hypothetical protein